MQATLSTVQTRLAAEQVVCEGVDPDAGEGAGGGGSGEPAFTLLHADHLGRPAFATSLDGAIVWDGGITTPFGQQISTMGAFTQSLHSPPSNRWRAASIPGQYADAESGLSHNWHRTYDPTLGRYLQSDASGALRVVDNETTGIRTEYISGAGGKTLARVDVADNTPDDVTYMHNDHLGSSSVGTNGTIKWTEHYTPYGMTLLNPAELDDQAGFTGHIKDKATGLNYMQARYYDPAASRFLSIDPVTFAMTGEPRFVNRYAYAFNDPVNLTDPTGMAPGDQFDTYDEAVDDFASYVQSELS